VTLAPIRLARATPCWTAFEENSDPSVGIRMLVYIALFPGQVFSVRGGTRARRPPIAK
jgi:hypothetical protein